MSNKLITCDTTSDVFDAYISASFMGHPVLAVWVTNVLAKINQIPFFRLKTEYSFAKHGDSVLRDGYEFCWLTLRLKDNSFLLIQAGLNRELGDIFPIASPPLVPIKSVAPSTEEHK